MENIRVSDGLEEAGQKAKPPEEVRGLKEIRT
jgi:hypothetical protein